MSRELPAKVQNKIERLERENELLREEIAKHLRIYGDTLGELVTLKTRLEMIQKAVNGGEE